MPAPKPWLLAAHGGSQTAPADPRRTSGGVLGLDQADAARPGPAEPARRVLVPGGATWPLGDGGSAGWSVAVDRAPDLDGVERSVIVFRLRPIGNSLVREADASDTGDVSANSESELVGLEAVKESAYKRASQEEKIVVRREDELVKRYAASLGAVGGQLKRWKVRPAETLLTLYTDPYHEPTRELYEAKASSKREDIRMALGQILDYERWISPRPLKRTVLAPSKPPADLIGLLHAYGVGLVFETSEGNFERLEPPDA